MGHRVLVFTFVAAAVSGVISPAADASPTTTVSIADVSALEGTAITNKLLQIPIVATPSNPNPMTVQYTITPGSATAISDYVPPNLQQLNFPALARRRVVNVKLVSDDIAEPDETFVVTIVSVTGGAVIGNASATITIRNDDGAVAPPAPTGSLYGFGARSNRTATGFTHSPTRVGTASDWDSVSAGIDDTCAVRAGTLWCWGVNNFGQLGDGTTAGHFAPTQVGSDTNWVAVEMGATHGCATKSDQSLWCWGRNVYGELGDGTTTDSPTPVQVGAASHWATVAAGTSHTCAVDTLSAIWCWGDNTHGQLGDGTTVAHPLPTAVPTGAWSSVSAGGTSTCAVALDHTAWCWGDDHWFVFGEPLPQADVLSPLAVQSAITDWASVSVHNGGFLGVSPTTCGVRLSGAWMCWGGAYATGSNSVVAYPLTQISAYADYTGIQNGYGNHWCAPRSSGQVLCYADSDNEGDLGVNAYHGVTPVPVDTTTTGWTEIAAGSRHTCGIANHQLFCWGSDEVGQLGDGGSAATPAIADSIAPWRSVSAATTSCGVRADASLWCWGDSGYGAIGDNLAEQYQTTPKQVGGASWSAVAGSPSGYSKCAIRGDGSLWCWGNNGQGQLGFGNTINASVPTQVVALDVVTGVATGNGMTCAIRGDRSLWCWGTGYLGFGTAQTRRLKPTVVHTGTTWISVSVGLAHTCAIKSNHSLWCWGINAYGQLGVGDQTNRAAPTQVGSSTSWASVSSGEGQTCGTLLNGTALCWGHNATGQLGTGDLVDRFVPTALTVPAATWQSVSSGPFQSCAVTTAGELMCWGLIDYGILGDPNTQNVYLAPHQFGPSQTWTAVSAAAHFTLGVASP